MRGDWATRLLGALAILAGLLLAPATALAQSEPTLKVPSFAACGSNLTIEGSQFQAEQSVIILATQPAPQTGSTAEVDRVTASARGSFRVAIPGPLLGPECRDGATFVIRAMSNEGGQIGEVLAQTRVTYGSPAPAATQDAPSEGDGVHPAIVVAALVAGGALLRTRDWLPRFQHDDTDEA